MTAPAFGTLLAFRLRVRDASTLTHPDGTTDALVFSTLSGVGNPYVLAAPTGDGAEIDVLTGQPTLASYRITVVDVNSNTAPSGLINPGGVVTAALGDTLGRNQLLSRRAYIEVSPDGGTTWNAWCTGYVNRIRLVDAATYEFSIGETRRLEQATIVFQTITPGLDGGTCILGGPIAGTPQPAQVLPHAVYTVTALPWNNSTSYVLGNIVQAGGIIYICINPNTSQAPPQAAFWQPVPAPYVPSGVYAAANTYAVGQVVVGLDGNAYVALKAVPINTPPPNITYWEPLQAVLLPSWGMVQDFGGVNCTVSTVGGNTASLKITLVSGWFKIPIKNPGEPAWRYAVGTKIPADFSSANALIPALAAQYGQSPVGYGGTYLNPWGGPLGNTLPKGVKTTNQGGVVDSVLGQLGWTIGGVALQIQLPSGSVVTVGAYPQLYNTSVDKGTRYTVTPVLIYPKSRTILVDWHDFYRIDPTTGNAVLPYDQNGNQQALPPAGTTLLVKAVVVPISDQAPLHVAAHPIDLLSTLWNNAGISYNASNVAAMRAALGSDLVLVARITQSMSLGNFFETYIGGPLGVGIRISSVSSTDQHGNTGTGYYEIFDTRTPPTALPTVAWTDADCYSDGGSEQPMFDLDEQTICQSVLAKWQTFVAWDPTLNSNRPLDDVVPIDSQATYIDADFATYGSQTADYELEGGYAHALMQGAGLMSGFMNAKATHIFERFGRGATRTTLPIVATSTQANLGDLVLVQSIRLPNPAINQRGGARLCMVIKKTPFPQGALYDVQDLGASSQPAQIVPTFTLAGDLFDPSHVVDATVTNLNTLQTTYPGGAITMQYAVSSSAPSGNGVLAIDTTLSSIPSSGLALPALPIGSKVWVRMQVRPGQGLLPSAWSAWSSFTLATPNAITNLTWTDAGNGAGTLSWTNTDGTTPIQLWLSAATGVGFSPVVTTVFVDVSTFSLQAGATATRTAQAFDQNGNPMAGTASWSSSNPSIATVNSVSGLVTAVAVGTCTIIATIGGVQGTSALTVTTAAGVVGSVTVTPNPFSGAVSTGVTFTAVVKDTLGNVMGGRTITWATTAGSFASNVLTLPSSANPSITVTATDVGSGVQGTATGQAVVILGNIAQLSSANLKTFLTTLNTNYPNDNFAYIGGAKISATQQAALGLPNISFNYGTFTPGVVDGGNWPLLVDTNGVAKFAAASSATASSSNATIESMSTQMWVHVKVLVDPIKAMALNTSAKIMCIGTNPTSGKKFEMYCQMGSTAGSVQFNCASFSGGSTRTATGATAFVQINNLSTNPSTWVPNGCWLNCIAAVDTTSTQTLKLWVYDDAGTLIASGSTALSTALTTGAGTGVIMLNQAYNGGTSQLAMTYGGLAVLSGPVFSTPTVYRPRQLGDTGLAALYTCGDAVNGAAISTMQAVAGIGANLTTSGTVTGVYDNGNPFNWLKYPAQSGAEIVDETGWEEGHFITGVTSPTQISFAYPFDSMITKCRSLGIRSRAYLIEGSGHNAIYGTVVNSLTACKQTLQTIVTGIVTRNVQVYGKAAQGGVAVYNINEFINNGGVQGSTWQSQYPISLTGTKTTGWAGYLANLILTADPTCKVMFNFNNIHLAGNLSQQNACVTFMTQFFVDYPAVSPTSIICGNEFHITNASLPSASDASAWHAYALRIAAIGCWIHPSECDCDDMAFQGTGSAQRTARQQLIYQAWQPYFTTGSSGCFGEPTVWAKMYGLSQWQINPIDGWKNINAIQGAVRTDDLQWGDLVDTDYSRLGGAGSNRDVLGLYMSFLQTKAAGG